MFRFLKTSLVAVAAVVFSASSVAGPIVSDWRNPGDELLVQDQNTGLEWLNFSLTRNTSFTGVGIVIEAGAFETFRIATFDEVLSLLRAYGLEFVETMGQVSKPTLTEEERRAVELLQSQLGVGVWGAYDSVSPAQGFPADLVRVFTFSSFVNNGSQFLVTDSNPELGTFLVRSTAFAVPEPAGLGLLIAGLTLLRRRGAQPLNSNCEWPASAVG